MSSKSSSFSENELLAIHCLQHRFEPRAQAATTPPMQSNRTTANPGRVSSSDVPQATYNTRRGGFVRMVIAMERWTRLAPAAQGFAVLLLTWNIA